MSKSKVSKTTISNPEYNYQRQCEDSAHINTLGPTELSELVEFVKDKKDVEMQILFPVRESSMTVPMTKELENIFSPLVSTNNHFEILEEAILNRIKEQKTEGERNTTLESLFKRTSHYQKVKDILVKEGLCQPVTYMYKDRKKGRKGNVLGIIETLKLKGYFIRQPSVLEIQGIALSFFATKISASYIVQYEFNEYEFEFIPYAVTLE